MIYPMNWYDIPVVMVCYILWTWYGITSGCGMVYQWLWYDILHGRVMAKMHTEVELYSMPSEVQVKLEMPNAFMVR